MEVLRVDCGENSYEPALPGFSVKYFEQDFSVFVLCSFPQFSLLVLLVRVLFQPLCNSIIQFLRNFFVFVVPALVLQLFLESYFSGLVGVL